MTNSRRNFMKQAGASVGALSLPSLLQAAPVDNINKKKIV
jgi:hypothetical protein